MKRREKPRLGLGGIPLEPAVGRAFEVWADLAEPEKDHDWGSPAGSVISRYFKAWDEYLHQNGIDHREGVGLRPTRGLYSVDFLVAEGRRAEVEQLLGDARVADLPSLRARAEQWLVAYRERVGHP